MKRLLLVRREKLERILELYTDSYGACLLERAGFGSIFCGVFTELAPMYRLNKDQISVSVKLVCQHFAGKVQIQLLKSGWFSCPF